MASAKIGVIIGIIILIAGIAVISSSSETNSNDNQEISQSTQAENPEDIEPEAHDFYLDEEGNKVIVINTGDSLSIGE